MDEEKVQRLVQEIIDRLEKMTEGNVSHQQTLLMMTTYSFMTAIEGAGGSDLEEQLEEFFKGMYTMRAVNKIKIIRKAKDNDNKN